MEHINLTPVLQAIIGLICALITYKLIPWIKARTTEAQQANIRAAVKTAVFAAEQLFGSNAGKSKKQFVVEWLRGHGYTVDTAEIEAAVAEYLNPDRIADRQYHTPDTSTDADDLK